MRMSWGDCCCRCARRWLWYRGRVKRGRTDGHGVGEIVVPTPATSVPPTPEYTLVTPTRSPVPAGAELQLTGLKHLKAPEKSFPLLAGQAQVIFSSAYESACSRGCQ